MNSHVLPLMTVDWRCISCSLCISISLLMLSSFPAREYNIVWFYHFFAEGHFSYYQMFATTYTIVFGYFIVWYSDFSYIFIWCGFPGWHGKRMRQHFKEFLSLFPVYTIFILLSLMNEIHWHFTFLSILSN